MCGTGHCFKRVQYLGIGVNYRELLEIVIVSGHRYNDIAYHERNRRRKKLTSLLTRTFDTDIDNTSLGGPELKMTPRSEIGSDAISHPPRQNNRTA